MDILEDPERRDAMQRIISLAALPLIGVSAQATEKDTKKKEDYGYILKVFPPLEPYIDTIVNVVTPYNHAYATVDHFVAMIIAESDGNPDAISGAGAIGIMQLMDLAAIDMGLKPFITLDRAPYDVFLQAKDAYTDQKNLVYELDQDLRADAKLLDRMNLSSGFLRAKKEPLTLSKQQRNQLGTTYDTVMLWLQAKKLLEERKEQRSKASQNIINTWEASMVNKTFEEKVAMDERFDWKKVIEAGVGYAIKELPKYERLFRHQPELAVMLMDAGYNYGPRRVLELGRVPVWQETVEYVWRINHFKERLLRAKYA